MQETLRVAFIGAGQVNFGGCEGEKSPWDHATRIELISRLIPLVIVGIADPDTRRAEKVLFTRRSSAANSIWNQTTIFGNYITMLDECKPDAVFIGTPPYYHGSIQLERDIEVQCAQRNVHMFIEKPISCAPLEDVESLEEVLNDATKRGIVISVGYMFRYSKTILRMKQLIKQYGEPKTFNARYNCAYSTISKPMWWDIYQSGGPIVEQATHFCDLARYLVGDINLESVRAFSIKSTDIGGKLNFIPSSVNEDLLPIERRIPRVTTAMWKFNSGAIGSLMHGALLHESKYESELEVWGDGYKIVLVDPYEECKLIVRSPQSNESFEVKVSDDEYYYHEVKVFLEAVQSGNTKQIQSPFCDALQTYRFTWAIRTSAESS
jgi:predicted dehydrogenase